MLYQTVKPLSMNNSRVFTKSLEYDDPVWTDTRSQGDSYGIRTETSDEDFAVPDFKQHIFTTYSSLPVNAMLSNNFVFPVRVKTAMASRRITDEIQRRNPNVDVQKGGVYIVSEYKVGNKYSRESKYFNDLISYYQSLQYEDNTYTWVANELSRYIRDLRTTNRVQYHSNYQTVDEVVKNIEFDNLADCISVRITSFIPIEMLRSGEPVYLREEGVLLYTGSITRTIAHPGSDAYINDHSNALPTRERHYIAYEIVDNSTTNDYYMKMGTETVKLDVVKDVHRKEGLYVREYKNSIRLPSRGIVPLDKLREKGIYTDKDEANANGTESYGKNLEFEKLKYAYEELKAKSEKLQIENQMAREEREFKLCNNELTANLAKQKFVFDSLLTQSKFNFESQLARDKFALESELLESKIRNDAKLSNVKAKNEKKLTALKLEQDRIASERKASLDYVMSRHKLLSNNSNSSKGGGDHLEGALDAMKTTSSILRDLS